MLELDGRHWYLETVRVCDFTALTSFKSLFPSSLIGTFLRELDASRFSELVFHIRQFA